MCVTSDETTESDASATWSSGGLEEMVVTAPRIGINLETLQNIDWTKVAPLAVIGGIGGIYNGLPGITLGSILGAATSLETQDGVGILNLFQLENDIVYVPGLPAPYIPLF